LALVDARQEAFLLRFGAEAQQHRRAHRQSERDERRRADVAELLLENVALHHVPAGAAPFLGPGRRHPAFAREDAVPAQQVFLRQVRVAVDFFLQVLWQVPGKPGAHFVAEGELLGRVVQVHGADVPRPYRMVTPPSAMMHCPVMNAAASEARNTAMPPMSRGSPPRCAIPARVMPASHSTLFTLVARILSKASSAMPVSGPK